VGSDTGSFDRHYLDGEEHFDRAVDYPAPAIDPSAPSAYPNARPKNPSRPKHNAPASNARAPLNKPGRYARNDTAEVIIGSSPSIRALRDRVRQYAPEDAPVCILGESGVGKELVASELHRYGRRTDKVFLPINTGAIPENLATAELFGHEKGSFTGAHMAREGAFLEANGGTLYLDEIGEMPMSIQAQLLRVLDDGMVTKIGSRKSEQVDIRLITATNVNLRENIATGKFRKDLYYRINVLPIFVPALRDRGDDIIEIAEHLISHHDNLVYRDATLTPRAIDHLRAHSFPGNVRELKNLISRAVVHARGGKITADHLSFDSQAPDIAPGSLNIAEGKKLMGLLIASQALGMTEGNVTKAAMLTGITRASFHKLKKLLNGKDYAAESIAIRTKLKALLDG